MIRRDPQCGWRSARKNEVKEDDELGRGSLLATGLIAGGALAGVIVALLSVNESVYDSLQNVNAEEGLTEALGTGGYHFLGVLFFAAMAFYLYRTATRKAD